MKIEISFRVLTAARPDEQYDRQVKKTFDVEWPGRPMPGEHIDIDIPAPIQEFDFHVSVVSWSTTGPVVVTLEPVRLPSEEAWDGGLKDWAEYCRKKGWEVLLSPRGQRVVPVRRGDR